MNDRVFAAGNKKQRVMMVSAGMVERISVPL